MIFSSESKALRLHSGLGVFVYALAVLIAGHDRTTIHSAGTMPARGGRSIHMKQYSAKANRFYSSKAWKNCRTEYSKKVGGLCERCYENGEIVPGEIVHHKEHLNDSNLNDPAVALNMDNLELLCRKCHAAEHPELYANRRRYSVDEYGNVRARKNIF